jgi:hypothetical protein
VVFEEASATAAPAATRPKAALLARLRWLVSLVERMVVAPEMVSTAFPPM